MSETESQNDRPIAAEGVEPVEPVEAVDGVTEAEEPAAAPPPTKAPMVEEDDGKRWYIVHTYSGQRNG